MQHTIIKLHDIYNLESCNPLYCSMAHFLQGQSAAYAAMQVFAVVPSACHAECLRHALAVMQYAMRGSDAAIAAPLVKQCLCCSMHTARLA
jgi:hypothetical protein